MVSDHILIVLNYLVNFLRLRNRFFLSCPSFFFFWVTDVCIVEYVAYIMHIYIWFVALCYYIYLALFAWTFCSIPCSDVTKQMQFLDHQAN